MHILQQHILTSLTNNSSLRYARLKPDEVEGNAFMYHLRQLIQAGYIEHVDEQYSLTAQGKLYVDRVRIKNFTAPLQPKIVILIIARNDNGEILFYERGRHPLINMVGFPYGKLHVDESIEESAVREFVKKTGYHADFRYHSSGIMKISEAGELVSYIQFLLVIAENISGHLIEKYNSGRAFWSKPEEVPSESLIPSIPDILKIAESEPGRFTELNYDL